MYTWAESQGSRESPYYYGIPASVVSALASEKKVMIVLPQLSKPVLTDIYAGFGVAYPLRVILLTVSPNILLERLKNGLLAGTTSSSVCKHYGLTPPTRDTATRDSARDSASGSAGSSTPSSRPQSTEARRRGAKEADASPSAQAQKLEEKLQAAKKKITKMLTDAEGIHAQVTTISNDANINTGVVHVLKALDFQGDADLLPPPSTPTEEASDEPIDLSTCSPDKYLQRTVGAALEVALRQLEIVRPADPIEYLALHLLRDNQIQMAEQSVVEKVAAVRDAVTVQVVCEKLAEMMEGRI